MKAGYLGGAELVEIGSHVEIRAGLAPALHIVPLHVVLLTAKQHIHILV